MSIRELIASLLCETNIDEEVTASHILKAYGLPDREVGEWETKKHPYIEAEVHFCTVCHRSSLLRTPYCAFCGARMKGEDDA